MSDKPNLPARQAPGQQGSGPGGPNLAERTDVHEERETLAKLVGEVLATEWLRARPGHSKGRVPSDGGDEVVSAECPTQPPDGENSRPEASGT